MDASADGNSPFTVEPFFTAGCPQAFFYLLLVRRRTAIDRATDKGFLKPLYDHRERPSPTCSAKGRARNFSATAAVSSRTPLTTYAATTTPRREHHASWTSCRIVDNTR